MNEKNTTVVLFCFIFETKVVYVQLTPLPHHPGHKMRVDEDGWAGMGIHGDNNQQESDWVRFRDKIWTGVQKG